MVDKSERKKSTQIVSISGGIPLLLILLALILMFISCLVYLTLNLSRRRPPHIVLVVADDLGWSDVGYHNPEIRTPTLDRLAREGVILEQHYAQPFCTPSRAALLSGKYPIRLGMQHSKVKAPQPAGLPLHVNTLADSLRDRGYSTHLIGKWDLGFFRKEYFPTNRGFDTFFGLLAALGNHFTHELCSLGFPTSTSSNTHSPTPGSRPAPQKECGYDMRRGMEVSWNHTKYSTHLFTTEAVNLIHQHDANKPMFLYLSYQAPHGPLLVPDEYLHPYKHIEDSKRRTFSGMVTCLDEGINNVTKALEDTGMWQDTVFVFISDNGGEPAQAGYNWPLRGKKSTLWEGGIRTVAFVTSSLLEKRGEVRQGLMHISDWYSTLVRLAGGVTDTLTELDGYNMWETISTGAPSPRTEILHNIDQLEPPLGETLPENPFNNQIRAAIRRGKWKLLTGHVGEKRTPGAGSWWAIPGSGKETSSLDELADKNLWLFDVESDPLEERDMSRSHPEVVADLLARLAEYHATAVPPHYPELDPQSAPSLHGGVWTNWMDASNN